MLNLTSTSDKVKLTSSIAGTIEVHASWADQTGVSTALTVTLGRLNTTISSTSTTDIVSAPAASTQRNVKHISIFNAATTRSPLITVVHTDGTNTDTLWKGMLQAGESAQYGSDGRWTAYYASGLPKLSGGPIDVQSYLSATGPTYWIKPLNATLVKVRMWGAGGGGGHGGATATTATLQGGSGGGGGAYNEKFFLANDLPKIVRVNVGKGGTATPRGAQGNGSGASPGGSSAFWSNPAAVELGSFPAATIAVGFLVFAGGGGGGFTGNAAPSRGGGGGGVWGRGETINVSGGTGIGGAGGVPAQNVPVAGGGPPGSAGTIGAGTGLSPGNTLSGEFGGGGGGGDNAGTGPGTSPGGSSLYGAGGGACGSGAGFAGIAVPHLGFPQQGGASGRYTAGGGGAAGTNGSGVNGTNGGDGPAGDGNTGGGGGGSGGGCDSTANGVAGNGGNGGWPGGGGGGGGSCTNRSAGGTFTSGIGGNGADGAIYIDTW